MINTLDYILKKFNLDPRQGSPLEIHNVNRTIMAKVLRELEFKVGAEVGVAEGRHSKVLSDENPEVELFCIDIYESYPGYNEYPSIEKVYQEAQENLKPYNCVFIKKFSMDAVKDFADASLDFVYIDCAHDFKNVAMDLCEWSKKVKVGGIVFGHDYKQHGAYLDKGVPRLPIDVKSVVNAFSEAKKIRPLFVLTNDIIDVTFGPDNPGWMFVRQDTDLI